jgi:hypothetical protein
MINSQKVWMKALTKIKIYLVDERSNADPIIAVPSVEIVVMHHPTI